MARESKRRTILAAAEKLLLSDRFDRVTVDDVCAGAGVGKGTIYRYFHDKEDLYAHVVLSGLDDLHASLKEKASRADLPEDQLVAVARGLHSFYRKRSTLFRSFYTGELRRMLKKRSMCEDLRARHRKIVELVASILSKGTKTGAYRRDVPVLAAARVFLATTREGSRPKGGLETRPVPAARLVSLFLDGIRKR